jgi:steroid delta-isomerase-like uncharacterized protein
VSEDPALNNVRRFWEVAFNQRQLDALDDMLAEDYVNHAALPGTPPGPAGQKAVMERLWSAFPDGHFTIEYLARDGDVVACIGTMTGTHEGELLGVPASGKDVAWRQCHLITVDDEGKARAHRAIRDDLGLIRQMGAMRG